MLICRSPGSRSTEQPSKLVETPRGCNAGKLRNATRMIERSGLSHHTPLIAVQRLDRSEQQGQISLHISIGGRAAPLNGSLPITVRIVSLVQISSLDLKLCLDETFRNRRCSSSYGGKDRASLHGISDYSTSSKPYSETLSSKRNSDDNIDACQHTPFTSHSRDHQSADLDQLLQTSCKKSSEMELNASMPACQAYTSRR